MKISQTGIDFIKSWEGLELDPYQDAKGVWTVGWGHAAKPGEVLETVTEEQAEEILRQDLTRVEEVINLLVQVKINQNQYNALCSFVFNCGVTAFQNSTLLKWLNDNRIAEIPSQLTRWCHAGSKTLIGLSRRRVAESALFLR